MSKRGKEQVAVKTADQVGCDEPGCLRRYDVTHRPEDLHPRSGQSSVVFGYGLAHGSKGWLAVCVSSTGEIAVLTPKRNGLDEGVSKPLALQQMMSAQREAVLGLK